MAKNIFHNIFSVEDYNETHRVLCILGLKIKYVNKKYREKIKNSPVFYYRKNNIDITAVPPATGQLRDIQLANLSLLIEFDRICVQNHLNYWFDYGSMLGAVRHKGYIPWDDDIDVGMIREDYEQIVYIFNKSTAYSDFIAEYNRTPNDSVIIKIKHKKSKYVCIDIFPFDFCSRKFVGKNSVKKTKSLKKLCKKIHSYSKSMTLSQLSDEYKTIRESLLSVNDNDKTYLMRGIDFCGFPNDWFYEYETIYPLNKIEFEGSVYSCVNNADAFLKNLYGNYMDYPKKIGVGHTAFVTLDEKEKEILKQINTEKEFV